MKINFIGYNVLHRTIFEIDRPAGANSHILIVTKAPGIFYINKTKSHVKENSVIIIKKGTPHNYMPKGKYYSDDWIHFELSEDEEKRFPLPFDTITELNDVSTISYYIEKMQNELYSQSEYKERKINLYFEMLYIDFMEKISARSKDTENYTSIFNIRALIYNQPQNRYKNFNLASGIGMSESYFIHTYRKVFGVSPIEDSIIARIERGKYLLKNSNSKTKDIAESLGYKSEVQFMRQFKKITGLTTLQYRQKRNSKKYNGDKNNVSDTI